MNLITLIASITLRSSGESTKWNAELFMVQVIPVRTEILIMLSSFNYHAICYFSINTAPCSDVQFGLNVKDLPTEGFSDVICLNNVYTTVM